MPRKQSTFLCRDCGHEHDTFVVQCENTKCSLWNTLEERLVSPGKVVVPAKLDLVSSTEDLGPPPERIDTGQEQFNLVLGKDILPNGTERAGGVRGVVHTLFGKPGTGKTTLATQTCGYVAKHFGPTLYVCGEENKRLVQARARRLGVLHERFIFTEHLEVTAIIQSMEETGAVWVVIDSIDKLYCGDLVDAARGGPKQRRESTLRIIKATGRLNCVTTAIVRVNAQGNIVGETDFEHELGASFRMKGSKAQDHRTIEPDKNRFGPDYEIGVFHMTEKGLVSVQDLSEIFSQQRDKPCVGAIATIATVGSRLVPVETHIPH